MCNKHNVCTPATAANVGLFVRIVANGVVDIDAACGFSPYGGKVYGSTLPTTVVNLTAGQTISILVGGLYGGTINPIVGAGQHRLKIIRLN